MCTTDFHSDAHTHELILNLHVGLCLDSIFVCLFRFSIFHVFYVSLDHFIPVLYVFIVLGFVPSVPSQEIGCEERLHNDPFCVE